MSDCILFVAHIFNIHVSGVLIALFGCCMADATWNCCHLGATSVYTIQPYTSLQRCHIIQSHTGRVYVCLAVACHLHFWRNDRDLLHTVTRGWNGYRNKSTPWRRKFSCRSLPGLEAGTFRSRVRCSNYWATPAFRDMMMSWCLMSSDVIWHIRDKLWPMPKHGSIKATYVRCMRV